jgi:hypothetical protein
MAKNKAKAHSDTVFSSLEKISINPTFPGDGEDEPLDLTTLNQQPIRVIQDTSRTLRMKKFRAQLLHYWLVNNLPPCRAADIGGGKGLLGYLLQKSGWQVTVIDPIAQTLPDKYKDILSDQRVKIAPEAQVASIPANFAPHMGEGFDLLIGMHAHGCNALIIDAAAQYGCGFILFPCCVIDEPFFPRLGVHWIECLAGYAVGKGLPIQPLRLNFKGQNIGLYHPPERALPPAA